MVCQNRTWVNKNLQQGRVWDMENYHHNLQINTTAKFLSNNILACMLRGDLDNNQAVIIFLW